MDSKSLDALLASLASHPAIVPERGTSFYSLIITTPSSFDSVQILILLDSQYVRSVDYHYHHMLTGETHRMSFDNRGNHSERSAEFVAASLSELRILTGQLYSPSESDQYFLLLSDFCIYRLLTLIRLVGARVSDQPSYYHLTLDFRDLQLLSQPLRTSPKHQAGTLDLVWK